MVDAEGFVSTPNGTGEALSCPYCEEETSFRSLAGAKSHLRRKHPDAAIPEEWSMSRTRSQTSTAPPKSEPIREPTPELKQIHEELVESIDSVGGIIAALIGQYKETTVTYAAFHGGHAPNFPVIGPAPYFETTFGHTISNRAPLSAKILMDYAERNSTLLALIVGFNKAMHGGEVAGLVADHVVGLAHTVMPANRRINGLAMMRTPDALAKVMEENESLRAEIGRLHREAQARQAEAGAAPGDERGSGNPG